MNLNAAKRIDLSKCPWCGMAATSIDEKRQYADWGCGSFKHGPWPYQWENCAHICEVRELEAEIERLRSTNVAGNVETKLKRVRKVTKLKRGQRLIVTVPRTSRIAMKVPEGATVAVDNCRSVCDTDR